MKVDKGQFDALLHKMMQSPPEPAKTIKRQGKVGKMEMQSPAVGRACFFSLG
jgi:hypothetical protein